MKKNNELTKKAKKTTIYFIKVEKDSLNNEIKDTLSIRKSRHNFNNQISNFTQKILFDDEKLEINYTYNNLGKIEIGKISNENYEYILNYIYKNTLLIKNLKIIFLN